MRMKKAAPKNGFPAFASLCMADQAIEVFTDGGSTRQRLPYGIRDYPSQDSQNNIAFFYGMCYNYSRELIKAIHRLTNGGQNKETSRKGGFFVL